MTSSNRRLEKSLPGPRSQASPETTISSAQHYIASDLEAPIAIGSIAQAIGLTVSDLKNRLCVVLQEDIKREILDMRLKALHTQIEKEPEPSLQGLASEVGLLLDQEIKDRIHEEFRVTPDQ